MDTRGTVIAIELTGRIMAYLCAWFVTVVTSLLSAVTFVDIEEQWVLARDPYSLNGSKSAGAIAEGYGRGASQERKRGGGSGGQSPFEREERQQRKGGKRAHLSLPLCVGLSLCVSASVPRAVSPGAVLSSLALSPVGRRHKQIRQATRTHTRPNSPSPSSHSLLFPPPSSSCSSLRLPFGA